MGFLKIWNSYLCLINYTFNISQLQSWVNAGEDGSIILYNLPGILLVSIPHWFKIFNFSRLAKELLKNWPKISKNLENPNRFASLIIIWRTKKFPPIPTYTKRHCRNHSRSKTTTRLPREILNTFPFFFATDFPSSNLLRKSSPVFVKLVVSHFRNDHRQERTAFLCIAGTLTRLSYPNTTHRQYRLDINHTNRQRPKL